MTSKEIRKKVSEFKKEYEIKEVNIDSLSLVTEKLGYVLVKFSAIENDKDVTNLVDALSLNDYIKSQRGFTFANEESRIIFLNEDLSEKEQLIVLSHELGHIVLGHFHKSNVIGNDVQDEFEANEFSHHLINSSSNGFISFTSLSKKSIAIIACSIAAIALAVGAFALTNSSGNDASGDAIIDETAIDSSGILYESWQESDLKLESDLESEQNSESEPKTSTASNSATVSSNLTSNNNSSSSNKIDTNNNSSYSNKSSSNSKTVSNSKTSEEDTTTATKETVPLITEAKYYVMDGVSMTEKETTREYLICDFINVYNSQGKITFSCSYDDLYETDDGAYANIYLGSGYSLTNEDKEIIKKTTRLSHEFSQKSPAWSRQTYTAYVYSSSDQLVFQSTNGN